MDYYFFLDESGDHGLTFVDENFPVFVLCGCLIKKESLISFEEKVDKLKKDIFGSKEIILHSSEIRRCEGVFQNLFSLELKEQFYERLNKLLEETDYGIIGAAVNKLEHIKKYGKVASDPYALSLSFILERLIFSLDSFGKDAKVNIKVEKRGRKEDQSLLSHYNSVIDSGTYYVTPERFAERIGDFKFHLKRENINGLQLADLCAYPLARYVINPKEPYIPFNVIKKKIYCDEEGKIEGWGLKIFP